MKLNPKKADKLSRIWKLVYEAYNLMEDIRPGGGFREYIDSEKFCKSCGIEKDIVNQLKTNEWTQVGESIKFQSGEKTFIIVRTG